MKSVNRQQTKPVDFPRSRRNHVVEILTSLPAGKAVPVVAMPLLREDSLSSSMTVSVEMMETAELLVNPVQMRVTAYLVPFLAMERFEGSRDQFDRSFMGQPKVDGGSVVPFIETHAMGAHGSNLVYKALGLHGAAADEVNTMYLEAYNAIWNFRAKNRSPEITPRTRLDATFAPAFWNHSRFAHIVPDFDQAVIDGEIALNLVDLGLSGTAAITGAAAVAASGNLTLEGNAATKFGTLAPTAGIAAAGTGGGSITNNGSVTWGAGDPGKYKSGLSVTPGTLAVDLSAVTAELAGAGVTISLSNLDLARKTQSFAKIRERYEGIADDYIIDMLMDGLSIPDQALKQPILLADTIVPFAQAKRYATDAGNLAESAVSGGAQANISLRVPRLNTGGVVLVMVECVPDQLFERQKDPFFHSANINAWPEALRDHLDPEKVDIVVNGDIDVSHASPATVFGYEPMNAKWNRWGPRVGGKFYRPTANTLTDQERQRIWAVETVNPVLSSDFYVVSSIHIKPFLDQASDPFECAINGNAVIEGNTQFGGVLVEATANYDAVLEKAPQERITKA